MGELIQHETSYHLWAPQAAAQWYLLTSIDEHSRERLYAALWERESSWAHIVAAKTLGTSVGCPLKYYVDNHSICRFVEKRAAVGQQAHAKEEDAIVPWKEVLKDLGLESGYALSPAAKGKVERPYRWIQDHLVRTCVRDGITTIEQAREVLCGELNQYRFKRIHSTTQEIPHARFERALQKQRTLFRPLVIPKPYQPLDDIFCYRFKRTVDAYRRITFHTLRFAIHGVPIREEVERRISGHRTIRMTRIRFWDRGRLVGQQEVKMEDLKRVRF